MNNADADVDLCALNGPQGADNEPSGCSRGTAFGLQHSARFGGWAPGDVIGNAPDNLDAPLNAPTAPPPTPRPSPPLPSRTR